LVRLPDAFAEWEDCAHFLPKLLMTEQFRSLSRELPDFPVEELSSESEWCRAMGLLSYVGHAYVWCEKSLPEFLPSKIAKPWTTVASKLGRPPILSYASYCLDNWRLIDPSGAIECGNIALIQNFLAGMDEEWFILIHVEIEAEAGPAIRLLPQVQMSALVNEPELCCDQLGQVRDCVQAMLTTLRRMPEFCDPYIYFHRVRPYIHGWKNHPEMPEGLVYEGCFDNQPQQFRGETGAQSSIIPCLDAMLGVSHADDPLKAYLLEMRSYMPPSHNSFLAALEQSGGIRDFVSASEFGPLTEVFNQTVQLVEDFRSQHLEYAANYIYKQIQTDGNNPSAVGTGGTPFMKYLKKHRDETGDHLLVKE
jgi:indoleamine 2,3-dioxygenase